MKFSIKDFFSKCVIFTVEILDWKRHFLCSVFQENAFYRAMFQPQIMNKKIFLCNNYLDKIS